MGSISEAHGSRETKVDGVSSTYQRLYNLRGYTLESLAFADLVAYSPPAVKVDGIDLGSRSFSLKPRGKASSGCYAGIVDWKHVSRTPGQDAPVNLGDEKLSFTFSMGSSFFTKAISQEKFDPTGQTIKAKDVGLAINVQADGSVDGLDVQVPGDGFQISTRLSLGSNAALINKWLKDRIAQLGTINDDTFRGLEAGDCLLRAFSGEVRADSDFDIVWDFAVVLGEDYTSTPFDTGRVSFALNRRVAGFDLIWVMYEPKEDTVEKIVVPEARGAYVAKVFEDSDFSLFGVGV